MRILIFSWRDPTHPYAGGSEVYIHELAKRWVAWGHAVTHVCGGYPGCLAEESMEGVRIIRRGRRFTVYGRAFFEYLLRLRNECEIIIDVENGIPFFSPFYARKPIVLVVHHVHKEVFYVETGFPLNSIGYLLESKVMPLAYRGCLSIAVSQSTKGNLVRLGIPANRIEIIYNGLRHNMYQPSADKAAAPTVLCLGRLQRYKRVDLLLHAMPEVIKACPGASLWIAGRGEARETLERVVQETGLTGHVKFWDFVSDVEKVRLLQQAWVLVSTSMVEGWGLSVLEANACGTPAVVFDVPGLRDAVLNDQTGITVADGNVESLSQKISLVLSDTSLRERLRKGALMWARRFNWDDSARSMLKILEKAGQGERGERLASGRSEKLLR